MIDFLKCVIYLAILGIASFFLGRAIPKKWFNADKFPYRAFAFENEGKIYDKIAIRKWKEKLPDMSVILPGMIPSKKLPKAPGTSEMELMLQETCIAEFIHTLLCVLGLGCVWIWNGAGGWIIYAVYVLGNLPFNIIQRYNRPKLSRIAQRLNAKENRNINGKQGVLNEKSSDTELQYGSRA